MDHVSTSGWPTNTVFALAESETVGAGGWIAKLEEADVPPPGAGFTTVTLAVPADATSAAPIDPANWVELTKVVARGLPFQSIIELAINPVPFTVRVNAAEPAVAFDGDKDVMAGSGLGATTENVAALEVPPPGVGFATVTE